LCGSDDSSVHIWDTLKNQHNGNATNWRQRKNTTTYIFQKLKL